MRSDGTGGSARVAPATAIPFWGIPAVDEALAAVGRALQVVGELFADGAAADAAAVASPVLVPGDSVQPGVMHIHGEGKQLGRIAKDLGIPRDALRKAIEKIKKAGGLRGNQNVDILPDGTVVDPTSGDPIGNVRDEQGK